MSHSPETGIRPAIERRYFCDESEVLLENLSTFLTGETRIISERFWMVRGDNGPQIASAIGVMLLGVSVHFPEFNGIGNVTSDGWFVDGDERVTTGLITFIGDERLRLAHPENTINNLLIATNDRLGALNPALMLEP